ncbi:TPA: ligand-binding protein SH3 [Aeromonas salmonicida]|uniref:SMR family transporter n=1 Tax=Aeromonas salmonicida TaxID=645 RepID=UPI0004508346|nr:SMR family transporter [Aeromonas salmonicida]ELI6405068.1 ligand-binding protein SH3 [Aeromonas salmonicida subsp. salmonicida]ASI22284.1 ligand-binding protein SH3 [Aeromonas salmonicida]ASI26597.1 ligand-binding protein SH3 [Aeromonas salmonicida]ASI30719.1 ligand-binding protein SH3 [Aeromonas salmonicida]ATD37967.1 ligand-binding protein SH3 [Aeromonas salmonicida subsp. masoucida]
MSPIVIILGAALLDIGANMAINRSVGFRHKDWGFFGILLVLCAFTLLSKAVGTGKIDLAVAYATWGAIGILGTALGGLLLFGERLKPIGWVGIVVMAVAVALLTTA